MRAAFVTRYNEPLTVRTVKSLTPSSAGVVITVDAAGVCGTDAHLWSNELAGTGMSIRLPQILGHEVAGTVVEVGPEVRRIRAGQRVVVPFHLACGECDRCAEDLSNLCSNVEYLGSTVDGAFAEQLAVPRADVNCVVLPESVSSRAGASLGCRFMTAYRAVFGVSPVRRGEVVAVAGAAGGVGEALLQFLEIAAAKVVAIEVEERCRAVAPSARVVIPVSVNLEEGILGAVPDGVDVFIDATGADGILATATHVLRPGGRHIQIGLGKSNPRFLMNLATVKELSFFAVAGNPHAAYGGLLDMVERGEIVPERAIARTVGFAGLSGALADLANRTGPAGTTLFDPRQ